MNKIIITLLVIVGSLFAQSDSYTLFPSGGAGESFNDSGTTHLYSVIGLPFVGMTSDQAHTIYSGYHRMSFVYKMMFNEAPIITSPSVVKAQVGKEWQYNGYAVDPDLDSITYTYLDPIPSGFTRVADPKALKTTGMVEDTVTFTLVASDPGTMADTLVVTVIPQAEIVPIVIDPTSILLSATEDEEFFFSPRSNYDGQEDEFLEIDYKKIAGPEWLNYRKNANGDIYFQGVPLNGDRDEILFIEAINTVTGEQLATFSDTIKVTPVNDAPVLTGVTDFAAIEFIPFSMQLTAEDVDDSVLTFALASGPEGLTISSTGLVSWTPDSSFVGQENSFIVAILDPSGASTSQTYNISVSKQGVPICQSVGPIDEDVSGLVTIPYTLFDADNNDLSFSLAVRSGDSVVQITPDALEGTISGIKTAAYEGSVVWNSKITFPGVTLDSLRLELTPRDAQYSGTPAMTNYFTLNNTVGMEVSTVSPVDGSEVDGYTGRTISISFTGYGLDTASFDETVVSVNGSVTGQFAYSIVEKGSTKATILLDKQPAGDETVSVSLGNTLLDLSGKPISYTAETYDWSYDVALVGDFNKDGVIADDDDLLQLATLWHQSANGALTPAALAPVESGPVFGAAPNLRVEPDAFFDYKDLVGFQQMWFWTTSQNPVAEEAATTRSTRATLKETPSRPDEEYDEENSRVKVQFTTKENLYNLEIFGEDLNDLLVGDYRVWFDEDNYTFKGITSGTTTLLELNGGNLFKIVEQGEGYIRVALTRLAKEQLAVDGSGLLVSLQFECERASNMTVQYNLLNKHRSSSEFGVVEIGPKSLLGKSNAKQSIDVFPLPAAPAEGTKDNMISDDLGYLVSLAKENGGVVISFSNNFTPGSEVVIDLLIRDAVGNTIVEENELYVQPDEKGRFAYYWNGANQYGRKVANGVYKVVMSWDDGIHSGMGKTVVGIKKSVE